MKTSKCDIAFDPSNKSNYIYLAYIWPLDDSKSEAELYYMAFPTLGIAMLHFNPWGDPNKWVNDPSKSKWSLDLLTGNPMKGFQVDIITLLLG